MCSFHAVCVCLCLLRLFILRVFFFLFVCVFDVVVFVVRCFPLFALIWEKQNMFSGVPDDA